MTSCEKLEQLPSLAPAHGWAPMVRVANDVARCNGGGIKGNETCAKCKRSYAFSGAYGYWIDPAIKGDECPNFLPS